MAAIPKKPIPTDFPKKITTLEIFQYLFIALVILYFGKTLFIPLSFAMLISFILYPVCKWMEQKGIHPSVAIGLSLITVALLFATILFLLFTQILQFSDEWQTLELKLEETLNQLSVFLTEQFGVNEDKQLSYIRNAVNNSSSQIFTFLKNTVYSFSESLYYLLIVPIFSALILSYRQLLIQALYHLFPPNKKEMIHEIIIETIHEYYKFIKGMLVVYLIVGLLNSIGLAIIGIPYPFLFGFTASILTFIPYVGIMVSSLLPITVAWITFNSIWYPLGVITIFSVVQVLEAYIIFPYAVGSRLKINTLAILVMIIAGGIIWGASGMILFIPFISIIKLIADRTESLKTLSMLLSDGKLKQ
ncbi:AI-2E family transporter [Flavobacterium sp. ZT3R18]|uniref:AI-2E family transporter n=1 Tax=Flavobacterium sp. ZT3R18 TaxID=2594429 RepID=UPI00117B22E6|nr:AI-2E family transporter [Flavobacterium sp. ZT3R18]TRX37295.1 AI-2E family transporter [Flavobacterium sp. ZT3R18]